MQNFVFHNPTKVIFGRETGQACGKETSRLGSSVLLVYGRQFAESSGLLARVDGLLCEAGLTVTSFGGIAPNPSVEAVREGIACARQVAADVVFGLGGGSVIDSAKAIACGVPARHDVWKFFTGKRSLKAALPIVAMSTIAGSGSEMNSGMVLGNSAQRLKFGFGHRLLFPRVAFLDPSLTQTVSPEYTVYGAIDALTHLLEFYLTTTESNTLVQDGYMEGLARAIVVNLERVLADPFDYDARAAMMWASGLALNGLSVAGLGKVGFPMHLLEHPLSALYDTVHGRGLAVIMVGWLKIHAALFEKRIASFFSRAFATPFSGSDEAILALIAWLEAIDAPTTLAQLGIAAEAVDDLTCQALPQAKIWRMREYDSEKVRQVFLACEPA